MPFPDGYLDALECLARACETYQSLTGGYPILVGGAAVALYSAGEFQSGDFDLVASDDGAFDGAMLACGFVREDRAGHLLIGYHHPEHPGYGVQQVSGPLFDGRADRARLVRVVVTAGPECAVVLPSIEDIIADRLAQHAVASPADDSRLRQGVLLFRLADTPDLAYLKRRILEEGGDPAWLGL